MIKTKPLLLLAVLTSLCGAQAQQAPSGAGGFQVRAFLHDPVNPVAELYLPDQTGRLVKLNLEHERLTLAQPAGLINGSLLLFNTDKVDPKKPEAAAALAATISVPTNASRGILIVLPSPPDTKPAYRGVFIDDTPAAFPKGESKVISLIPVETAIEAGEHKLPVHPGKITNVPPVTKRDEFNQAQTNFYYREGESWVAFTERQLKYLDVYRRIFIVYATPGSTQPFVRTVLDTAPAVLPKSQ
jgi:hypothetical protein